MGEPVPTYRGVQSVYCRRKARFADGDADWECELSYDDDMLPGSPPETHLFVGEVVVYDPPELVGQGARHAPFVRNIQNLDVRRRTRLDGIEVLSVHEKTGGRTITCHHSEVDDVLTCGVQWRLPEWERLRGLR